MEHNYFPILLHYYNQNHYIHHYFSFSYHIFYDTTVQSYEELQDEVYDHSDVLILLHNDEMGVHLIPFLLINHFLHHKILLNFHFHFINLPHLLTNNFNFCNNRYKIQ